MTSQTNRLLFPSFPNSNPEPLILPSLPLALLSRVFHSRSTHRPPDVPISPCRIDLSLSQSSKPRLLEAVSSLQTSTSFEGKEKKRERARESEKVNVEQHVLLSFFFPMFQFSSLVLRSFRRPGQFSLRVRTTRRSDPSLPALLAHCRYLRKT